MKKLTNEEFIEKIKKAEIELKCKLIPGQKYVNNKTKIRMLCLECQKEFLITPHDLFSGHRCKSCAIKEGSTKRHSIEEVRHFIEDNGFTLKSEEYKNNKEKLEILCPKCNNTFKMAFNYFKSGQRCPFCRRNRKVSQEEFKKRILEIFGLDEYSFDFDSFKNTDSRILVIHNICGNSRLVLAHRLLKGDACPVCNKTKSIGEEIISKLLLEHNIKFKEQYSFKDLPKSKFDFVIFNDDKPTTAIEYDGIQHFSPIPFFGGIEEFKKIRIRDLTKNDFCEKNSIILIRISYKNKNNIEKILKENNIIN